MVFRILAVLILLGLVHQASADDELERSSDISTGISINNTPNSDASFYAKGALSRQISLVGHLNFNIRKYHRETQRIISDSSGVNIDSGYITDNYNANVAAGGGFRKYLNNKEYRLFVQPIIQVLVSYENSNFYHLNDEDTEENRKNSIRLGAGVIASIGIEHHITDRISLEGQYYLSAQYIGFDLISTDIKSTEFTLNEGGRIYVNYYW